LIQGIYSPSILNEKCKANGFLGFFDEQSGEDIIFISDSFGALSI